MPSQSMKRWRVCVIVEVHTVEARRDAAGDQELAGGRARSCRRSRWLRTRYEVEFNERESLGRS
jgi:hypothetical protein